MTQDAALNVLQLAEWRDKAKDFCLIDVREAEEVDVCQIGGSLAIPLAQIGRRIAEIPQGKPVVFYCHHGMRSQRAAQYLQQQGFTEVYNLEGGIDAWAIAVEPGMARY